MTMNENIFINLKLIHLKYQIEIYLIQTVLAYTPQFTTLVIAWLSRVNPMYIYYGYDLTTIVGTNIECNIHVKG